VPAILAQVGDVGGARLIYTQGIVQQQPHHRRGMQRLGARVGIGRGDQGPGLVPVQADGSRIVRSTTGRATPWVGTRLIRSWAAQYR
jgi:hypothetical protein